MGIVQSLLTIGITRGIISKDGAREIVRSRFYGDRTGVQIRAGLDPKSRFLVDLDVASQNLMVVTVDNLAKDFEQMTVCDEITKGII